MTGNTAFSDGVIAIIITIMVLELRAPQGHELPDLAAATPTFLSYALSFIYVALYWLNHHHLLYAAERVNGAILWANIVLLFFLSLMPFSTAWLGDTHGARWPTIVYGASLLAPAIAYYVLQSLLINAHGSSTSSASPLPRSPILSGRRRALPSSPCSGLFPTSASNVNFPSRLRRTRTSAER